MRSISDLKINKYFHVTNTVAQMLSDRGYTIEEPEIFKMKQKQSLMTHDSAAVSSTSISFPEFKKLCEKISGSNNISPNSVIFICNKTDKKEGNNDDDNNNAKEEGAFVINRVMARYILDPTVSMNTVLDLRADAQSRHCQGLILIATGSIPPVVRRDIENLQVSCILACPTAHMNTDITGTKHPDAGHTSHNGGGIVGDIVERGFGDSCNKPQPHDALPLDSSDPNRRVEDRRRKKKEEKENAIRESSKRFMPVHVEIFEADDLVFNPLSHELVPPHVPLTKRETDKLLGELGVNLSQLPRMKFTDPIAKYYGLSRGCTVKIIRSPHSDVVGEHLMYRQIV